MEENNNNAEINTIPSEYEPISSWGYIGYNILFAIPIVGIILIIIFALGGAKNKNLKNYARSFVIGYIIVFVLIGLFVVAFGATAKDILIQYS